MKSILSFLIASWTRYLRTRRSVVRALTRALGELSTEFHRSRHEAHTLVRTVIERNATIADLRLELANACGLLANKEAGALALANEIIALTAEKDELRRLALTDQLTGLLSRHGEEKLVRPFIISLAPHEDHRRYKTDETHVLVVDIDHFKRVNDTLGHAAADKVLRALAEVIGSVFHRQTDFVVRSGGEEITIVIGKTPRETAYRLARNLLERIRHEPRLNIEGFGQVTASLGVSSIQQDGEDPYAAYMAAKERADQAMYTIKQSGRNDIAIA
ncbi:MAG: GGDEF domain-containing protein [Undibacterium sp.]